MKGWYELEGLMWKDIDGILGSILGTIGSAYNSENLWADLS